MSMKPEARSVPVVWENDRWGWTPYRIGQRPDRNVRVTPYFTAPVEDFTQEKLTVSLPYERGHVRLTRIEPHRYDVGGVGELEIFTNACRFTSSDGTKVFTASIPSRDRTDAICTGLAILGAAICIPGPAR